MGSPRERSAQRSIAREGGNEVPQVIRNGIESNTETATVMSYLQQQGRLSSAWAAPSAVTSGRVGHGSETGTGTIWASENSSELIQRQTEGARTSTVVWAEGWLSKVFSFHGARKGTFVKTAREEYKLIENWQKRRFFFIDVIREKNTAKLEDSLGISLGTKSYLLQSTSFRTSYSVAMKLWKK